MTIGNLSHLGSVQGAVRDQPPPVARGIVTRAPATVNDSLAVALDGFALAFPTVIPAGHWTPRGAALPLKGAVCCVVFDGRDAWLVGYEGTL